MAVISKRMPSLLLIVGLLVTLLAYLLETVVFEDAALSIEEIIEKYGYSHERHQVTTEDGYILSLFRITSKLNGTSGHPILLMHGFGAAADAKVANGNKSVSF